ncbi:Wzz/FepE/Etk N-terminal domain-containing protein [Vibrio ostreae]|uniref:LPS O-antigen length regulator n=1 Tax=Vibrio ostreae TaxID=2841925 RepID=A0A975U8P2_9VIBR|nr:Wzz/FepE/Etk N-terminal domain-containing protein [Vibrio ostreae]QXO17248.1 LPS O-antigen length regulator [Vibrio ostreae]
MQQKNYINADGSPSSESNFETNEAKLHELIGAIWKGKWFVIFVTSIFAIGSVFFAIKQPNIYKADVLLAPSESSSGGGLSKMAGQLGGLAALAGVNIGGAKTSQTELAIQVMQSRQFVETFIKEHDLLIPLMATEGWDLKNNELLINKDIYDIKTQKWLREPSGLRGSQPTAQEAYDFFIKGILGIGQGKDSGLYTVSISHYSPFIAKQWLDWLIEDINDVMRERAISETTQNLAYLNSQLQKTAVADMKSTFYKLIEEQTKSLMLAEVQEEFVFKTVDPAIIPEVKDKPKRALICIIGTLLGGALSVSVWLLIFALRKQ